MVALSWPKAWIYSFVAKVRPAGEVSSNPQDKDTQSQWFLILGLKTANQAKIFTWILPIRGGSWEFCNGKESKAFSGIHGSAVQLISTWCLFGAWSLTGGSLVSVDRKGECCLLNGALGQRYMDCVTVFNMCPTCYFSLELTKWAGCVSRLHCHEKTL